MAVRKTQDQYVQELAQESKRIHYMAYALIVLLIAVIVVSVLKQFMLTSIHPSGGRHPVSDFRRTIAAARLS